MIVCGNFNHLELNFDRVDLEKEEVNGKRFYKTPDGIFPSVTTVTGWEKRNFFAGWRKNNLEESKRVCARGNRLHSMTERYLLNDKLNLDEYKEEIDLFNTLKPELDKIKNIYCLEYPLWSKVLGLAGRVDCIAEYDKQLSIIDFKGSTKLKKKEHIENYFLQASAYALMWQERTGMKIKDIKILISTEYGTIQVFEEKVIDHVPRLREVIMNYRRENPNGNTETIRH